MRQAIAVAWVAAMLTACGGDDSGLPAVGTLERDRIEVVAEARETLLEILVREGEAVAAGTLLVRQDDARAQAQQARAEAAAERARRRLDELLRGPRREDIAAAQAALEGARSRERVEIREHERVVALVARGLVSATELDAALARRDAAAAERRQREAQVDALLEGTTVEELDQARAALAEADAALEDARLAVARLALHAPRDGVVDALPYKRGDRPPAGATVVVLLADAAPYARIHVPQAVRARIRPGISAEVRVDGVEQVFQGEVRYVAAEAAFTPYYALTERDRSRLSYVAEVVLTGPEARELPTGLPVEVDFPGLAPR
jgi:HlyD family secretion protein